MHVLILASWYPTAGDRLRGVFFREHALALKQAGFQVGVIAPHRRSLRRLPEVLARDSSSVEYDDDHGIPTYRHQGWPWLPRIPYAGGYVGISGSGARLYAQYAARHGPPDLVHAQSVLLGGVVAAGIKTRHGAPYVITEHSSAFARGRSVAWRGRVVREAFRLADTRVMVSPQLGRLLEARFGDAVRPWVWVPNMVDARFRPAAAARDGPSPSGFRFLNVGSLHAHKGHRDLLDAFARRFRGEGDVRLTIGGDGPLRGELERLARHLGIGAQVAWLGRLTREQVASQIQASDALVLSSHVETFGIVLIEALACGKPVVATACGGPECIVHDGNGVLVPPRDIDRLGEAMAALRHGIRRYDPDAIRHDCLARFGQDAVVKALSAIYAEVQHRRARGA